MASNFAIQLAKIELNAAYWDMKFKMFEFMLRLERHSNSVNPNNHYNPDQPRDDHGRWTSGGSGAFSDANNSSNRVVVPKPSQNVNGGAGVWSNMNDASPRNAILTGDDENLNPQFVQLQSDDQYRVNIQEEDARGGHINKHIGISDEQLRIGLSQMRYNGLVADFVRADYGSFYTQESANDFINQTLQMNRNRVNDVAGGKEKEDFIIQRFGYETGKEAHRDKDDPLIYMRKTYEVGVGIYNDPRSPRGYSVYTAYPYNRRRNLEN